MIRIAIVDDHKMFRTALKESLKQIKDFEVVAEAECGKEYESIYDPALIDITLLDIRLAGQHGPQTCINIKKKNKDARVIALSMYDEKEIIIKMIENGVCAYVTKDRDLSYLEHVIRMVAENQFYFDLDLGEVILKNIQHAQKFKLINGMYGQDFSEMEMQIAVLGCSGLTNAEIAKKLNVNVRTIESHKSNLFVKTDSKNFGGVMIYMFKHYLLFPQDF